MSGFPTGLTDFEVRERQQKHGLNILTEKKKTPLIIKFLEEFADLMVLILIFAAVVALIGGEVRDATVILVIVVLNATIGFIQKFRAEKAIDALKKLVAPKAHVKRNGQEMMIDAKELVPGDILILQEGDAITADARLLNGNELETNESVLTGESAPVAKNAQDMVFMSTTVTHGTAEAVVTATGMRTEFGKIAELTTKTEKDKTPLQKELFQISIFIGKITIVISLILLGIGIFIQHQPFTAALLFAASVAVAAVPEGLPATITIALALGVQKLAKENAIMRDLASVETLGAVSHICSDKTGTLTKNEMTVTTLFANDEMIAVTGIGYGLDGTIKNKSDHLHWLCKTVMRCNNAKLLKEDKKWIACGDPTEAALITLGKKAGIDENTLGTKMGELPFDSHRKRMTVITKDENGILTASVKGALESVLPCCSKIYKNGLITDLTETDRTAILTAQKKMTSKALRVLVIAARELPAHCSQENTEKDLIFLGLCGMIDPPRENVAEAIRMTRAAGIAVTIVTGDNGDTARAIAHQIGLCEKPADLQVITGTDLEKMTDQKLQALFKKKQKPLFARVSPQDKFRIVKILKSMGKIVAVTGDGVNDAPALKQADIGVAMGITGTDVSKEAANMVLADDSFATIVTAIKEGRTIYDNIKKFIYYVFSCNIAELCTIFAAILFNLPPPLSAILILCIDIGTDVLPALAIGVEKSENGIMQRAPRKPKTPIMNKTFTIHYVSIGFTIGAIVVGTYLWTLQNYTYTKGASVAFALLVFIQMANAYNARSPRLSIFTVGLFTNLYLLGAIIISILTTIAIVSVPFLQDYLHTTSLTGQEWGMITIASLSILFIEECRKMIARRC